MAAKLITVQHRLDTDPEGYLLLAKATGMKGTHRETSIMLRHGATPVLTETVLLDDGPRRRAFAEQLCTAVPGFSTPQMEAALLALSDKVEQDVRAPKARRAQEAPPAAPSHAPPSGAAPLPPGFTMTTRGLTFTPPQTEKDPDPQSLWVCAPLYVTASLADETSDNHGHLLTFTDRHSIPQRWGMPLALLEEPKEYRKVLRRLGLKMSGSFPARGALQDYLDQAVPPTRTRCVDRVGWHEQSYVLPDTVIGPADAQTYVLQTLDHLSEGYRAGGTLEGWRDTVARLSQGNSRLTFSVSTAFAAPLLALTGDESGGLHFRGASSEGKTTTLQVACSVWGEPGRLERWRTTLNGLEGVALAHNDNLLCLDELRELDPREAGGTAYMLAGGAGKRRGQPYGGVRPRLTWRLLFLSSGELSLEHHMAEVGSRTYGGQDVRMVDIPADAGKGLGMFEVVHDCATPQEFADTIRAHAATHYGHAGRAFVTALVQDLDAVTAVLRALRSDWLTETLPRGASGQVSRVATRFGLIGAAGELATGYGLTGWPQGAALQAAQRCFTDWLTARGTPGSSDEDRAVRQVRLYFERYGESHFTPWSTGQEATCQRCHGTGKVDYNYLDGTCFDCGGKGNMVDQIRPVHDRAGFRKATADGRTEYYVFPEVFRAEVCQGFDHAAVVQWLGMRGLLKRDQDGKWQRKERLPGMGNKRVYVVTADILGDAPHEPDEGDKHVAHG
jgi:putative DNA primase/helicase